MGKLGERETTKKPNKTNKHKNLKSKYNRSPVDGEGVGAVRDGA
jgi:hypothetical protein